MPESPRKKRRVSTDTAPSFAAEQDKADALTRQLVEVLVEQARCVLEKKQGREWPRDKFTLLEYVTRTERCYHTKAREDTLLVDNLLQNHFSLDTNWQ